MNADLLSTLRRSLRAVADPLRATSMQAYTKSAMPYHGVTSPVAKKVFKQCFADISFESSASWQAEVLSVWHGAKFREERYGAIALAAHKSAQSFQLPTAMTLYEELIVTGAWWDYVDDLAIHKVGPIVATHPGIMRKKMLSWSRSQDLWKRRTAIICQIQLKDRLDLDLLYACIEPSIASKDFFLRKGIGWALRKVAWTEPREVIRYVKRNRNRLSPLSKREALKNVLRAGLIKSVP